MDKAAFDVPELRSGECERTVTSALINVSGVQWATAASTSGVAGVQFDSEKTDTAELLAAIEAVRDQLMA